MSTSNKIIALFTTSEAYYNVQIEPLQNFIINILPIRDVLYWFSKKIMDLYFHDLKIFFLIEIIIINF